jgi:hypothetical protein
MFAIALIEMKATTHLNGTRSITAASWNVPETNHGSPRAAPVRRPAPNRHAE